MLHLHATLVYLERFPGVRQAVQALHIYGQWTGTNVLIMQALSNMNKVGRPKGQTVKTTFAQREKREREDAVLKKTRVDEERQAKRALLEMMRGPTHKKVQKEVQENDRHHICAHPAIQENDEHDTCTPAMVPNMESLPVMPKTRKERQEGIKYRHLNKGCDVIVKWKGGHIVCTCQPSGLCRGEVRL